MAQQIQQLINELEATRWLFLPDWNKRILAAKRLGEQRAAQAMPKLSAVIRTENQNPDLCRAAIVALGQIGGAEAVSVLGAYVAHSTWHPIAVDALAQIGDAPAINALIDSYPKANSEQANRVEQALAQLSPADTATPLISGLGHSAADVRALTTRLLSSPVFTEPLITALGSNQAPIREQASTLLVRQGEAIVSNLILALAHPDEGIRSGASDSLAQLGQPAIPWLIEELAKSNTRAVNAASAALIKIGEPAIKPLIAILNDLNQAASAVAAQVLLNIGPPAVKPLMMALDTHPQGRKVLLNMEEAVRSTFKGASADEVPWLIGLLRAAPSDNELQTLLSTALREIGGAAVPALLKLLASHDGQEKQMAVNALKSVIGYLGWGVNTTVHPILLQEFTNQDANTQETIIEILCEIVKDDSDIRPFAEGGRFRLGLHLYRKQLPLLLPYSLAELMVAMLKGEDFSYQKQSGMEDTNEDMKSGKEEGYSYTNENGIQIKPLEAARAIPQLQAIATIAPEFALPHYWMGQWYYLKLEEYEKAIQAFERATECSEYLYENREAKSYWWLGMSYGTASPYFDYEKSQACFQQAKDLGWDGELLYKGIFFSAQAAMDDCIEKGENPTLYLTAMRQMTLAASTLQGEANVKPLQSHLEQTEEMYARHGEAAAFAEILREKSRDRLIDRVQGMFKNDQASQAVPLLRQWVQEYPDDIGATYYLGEALVLSKQLYEAIKQLQKVIEMKPDMSEAWFLLGGALGSIGDTENAVACFTKAAKLGNKEALMMMIKLMAQ